MTYGYWVPSAVLIFRSIVLAGLIGWRILDLHFFTYINYTLLTFLILLLIYSMREPGWFKLYAVALLPIAYGVTIYIAFAIVVIVDLNAMVLLRSSKMNGGDRDIGRLNTGNFLVHTLPLLEILFIVGLNFGYFKSAVRPYFKSLSTGGRAAYTLYWMFASVIVFVFYMLNFDYSSNYPTDLSTATLLAISIPVAVFTELLLYLGLILGQHDLQKEAATPISCWFENAAA